VLPVPTFCELTQLVSLKAKVDQTKTHSPKMSTKIWGNGLRAHRRKSGLTQEDLGLVVGYDHKGEIARHERSRTVPSLLTALAYAAVFQVPVSAIFIGIHTSVTSNVEANLRKLKEELERPSGGEYQSPLRQQKLEWLNRRLGR